MHVLDGRHVLAVRIGRQNGRSRLRAAISPRTTYGTADLRRSKLHTLGELPPIPAPQHPKQSAAGAMIGPCSL
jgi:hypothetical protein